MYEVIARIYADAARVGNPDSIVTFNPGIKMVRYTRAEDYTAGEINEPQRITCGGRWVDGAQRHMLSYLGPTWGASPPRFKDDELIGITRAIISAGGGVTWDVPIQPSGLIPEPFVNQLVALRNGLPSTAGTEAENARVPVQTAAEGLTHPPTVTTLEPEILFLNHETHKTHEISMGCGCLSVSHFDGNFFAFFI